MIEHCLYSQALSDTTQNENPHSPIAQNHQTSIPINTLPYVEVVPDALLIERAHALTLTAESLYHIAVHYRPLDDGTYEVLPVGDNGFTTIASVTHLYQAILDQISTFMESPAFIASQIARLAGVSVRAEGRAE